MNLLNIGHPEKAKTSEKFSEVFCTQDRDRTGTPKNWCLRPARLPIPPPGLDVESKQDVCFKLVCKYRNFFQCSKAF